MTNYSIGGPKAQKLNVIQKIGLILSGIGIGVLLVAWAGQNFNQNGLMLTLTLSALLVGILVYTYGTYANQSAGIKNDGVFFRSLTNKGVIGWISGVVLTLFYVYFCLKIPYLIYMKVYHPCYWLSTAN